MRNKMRRTKEADINKIAGKIYLTFVVDKNWSIDEIKIIKGLGYGLDEEAITTLKSYRNWIPGKMKGINVRVMYSLPLTLK